MRLDHQEQAADADRSDQIAVNAHRLIERMGGDQNAEKYGAAEQRHHEQAADAAERGGLDGDGRLIGRNGHQEFPSDRHRLAGSSEPQDGIYIISNR